MSKVKNLNKKKKIRKLSAHANLKQLLDEKKSKIQKKKKKGEVMSGRNVKRLLDKNEIENENKKKPDMNLKCLVETKNKGRRGKKFNLTTETNVKDLSNMTKHGDKNKEPEDKNKKKRKLIQETNIDHLIDDTKNQHKKRKHKLGAETSINQLQDEMEIKKNDKKKKKPKLTAVIDAKQLIGEKEAKNEKLKKKTIKSETNVKNLRGKKGNKKKSSKLGLKTDIKLTSAEELNQVQEVENLSHSNVLQVEKKKPKLTILNNKNQLKGKKKTKKAELKKEPAKLDTNAKNLPDKHADKKETPNLRPKPDVKPPSAGELNQLQEVENLFHSNLFHLQVEEMLSEVKPSDRRIETIKSWVEEFKTFLRNLQYPLRIQVSDMIPLQDQIDAWYQKASVGSRNVRVASATSVNVIGSFNIGCAMKPIIDVDIAVEMAKEMFYKEDYLNEMYLKKRKFYMLYVVNELNKILDGNLAGTEAQFVVTSCIDKPLLLIKSSEYATKKFQLFVHFVPERNTFKDIRFIPKHNNVRYAYRLKEGTSEGMENVPTPLYNAMIGQDVVTMRNSAMYSEVFGSNENMRNALKLLKIWGHQYMLNCGIGAFTNAIMAFYIVYLYKKKQINNSMSSYQIMRNVLISLSNSNLNKQGISLVDDDNKDRYIPPMDMFQSNYDIVIVDVTGYVNIAAFVHQSSYLHLKGECKRALEILSTSRNSFEALFMTPISFIQKFDQVMCFRDMSLLMHTVETFSPVKARLDMGNDVPSLFSKLIIPILREGLGDRVSEIVLMVEPSRLAWNTDDEMPAHSHILFGFMLNPESAYRVIDIGPCANLPEAESFRKFWGQKTELRRFRDGTVREIVLWEDSDATFNLKRVICRAIVRYLLMTKFHINRNDYNYFANEMEYMLMNPVASFLDIPYGTGEEITIKILNVFNNLSRMLRDIKELPLEIISVQGISSLFRFSDPFPPLPKSYKFRQSSQQNTRDRSRMRSPVYVMPIEVVMQLTSSSRWPDDIEAIRKLKSSFYIRLAEIMHANYNCLCQPDKEYLDVVKDGYVFRLRICPNNEIASVKRRIVNGCVEYVDNKESLYLEKKYVKLPSLTSALHGLHQQFPSFGPACCLAKRWLSSHMLDYSHVPDVCVDLLVSYLFLHPEPYNPPFQPQTAFLRFLNLLATYNWTAEPVILNFNNEMTGEEILEIERKFSEGGLENLVIVTPFDKSGVRWTKTSPSLSVLAHLSKLSRATLIHSESSFLNGSLKARVKVLFRSKLRNWDIIIELQLRKVPRHYLSINFSDPQLRMKLHESNTMPLVEFDPVQCYLRDLRSIYGEICTFFYDTYGGTFIGAILKPGMLEPRPAKVKNMVGVVPARNNTVRMDLESLMSEFHVLGTDVVKNIIRIRQ